MSSVDPSFNFDEDYEEAVTPQEVLQKMTTAWQNELCSPCLLPTQMELVDILLDQIAGMEEDIGKQVDQRQLRISVHRMELQRISFITSDYVRCRLRKIESNPNDAIETHNKRRDENKSDLLSEAELQFAREYAAAEAELFDKTVLEFMPPGPLKKVAFPLLDCQEDMVYAKVLGEEAGNVAVPDWKDLTGELVLEMEKSSCHLIPFDSVKEYLEEGTVQLL
ncbi:hypothetical protein CAEBREN_04194 [Caenorhabditis brenneri]|uniref:DNA replication complex GINS protein SLD5 n=1 Tax=Caenorhabditis brenneri TaxID=135651 RepID=G0N0X2_CAEBE|nr:hypothetical protein CAEBREN_04194 [Caenorhabditis brenneri]